MAVIESAPDLDFESTEPSDNNLTWRFRTLLASGLLQSIITSHVQFHNWQRVERLKKSLIALSTAEEKLTSDSSKETQELFTMTANLLAAQTVMGKRKEAVRRARANYDSLVYPAGMDSELAEQTAPGYRQNENGEWELVTDPEAPPTSSL